MPALTLERDSRTRLRRIFSTSNQRERSYRLPLQMELFLLAHADETGQPHLDQRTLTRGLAAAILLELWLTGRIQIGWRYDARHGVYTADPGRIGIFKPDPVGDPLTDAALAMIRNTGGRMDVRDFIRQFATADLYERVRADLVVTGIVRRTTRRRFLFLRRETHLPIDKRQPFQIRAKVRNLVAHEVGAEDTDHQAVALAGLITALGLTSCLNPPDMDQLELRHRLGRLIANLPHSAVREVVAVLSRKRFSASSPPN